MAPLVPAAIYLIGLASGWVAKALYGNRTDMNEWAPKPCCTKFSAERPHDGHVRADGAVFSDFYGNYQFRGVKP